ncbi:MAG: hypothetical protein IKU32_06305 [Clostridia bacterium]|jgi:hypothetical protein|nr:hypothetical protein [Clostridia bacterium]
MKYISIGAVVNEGTEYILDVCRCGNCFQLVGELAALWINGRRGFADAESPTERKALSQLERMGLAIMADGSDAEEYRTLNHATLVPADWKHPYRGLRKQERIALRWLREAGLVLSMAELTFLMDRGIELREELLGKENIHALVHTIYNSETICDNILENQMEAAASQRDTVRIVLSLLKKQRIVLL